MLWFVLVCWVETSYEIYLKSNEPPYKCYFFKGTVWKHLRGKLYTRPSRHALPCQRLVLSCRRSDQKTEMYTRDLSFLHRCFPPQDLLKYSNTFKCIRCIHSYTISLFMPCPSQLPGRMALLAYVSFHLTCYNGLRFGCDCRHLGGSNSAQPNKFELSCVCSK